MRLALPHVLLAGLTLGLMPAISSASHHSRFDLSIGLGFGFSPGYSYSGLGYCAPRYSAGYYCDRPVVYAPSVCYSPAVAYAPAVVYSSAPAYCPPPVVYRERYVPARSYVYESDRYYAPRYYRSDTRYYYGR